MTKETKTPNGPKILGEIDYSHFRMNYTSEGKKTIIKRKKNMAGFETISSSYIKKIEQREDLSKERKSTMRFFCEIVLPLYKILFYSKANDNICDYINKCNEGVDATNKRAAILDISTEQVFDILLKYNERRSVEELIYHYYPNISEFKTLKECLESNNKSLFCQKLEEYNKVEIYELCLYYLQLDRELSSLGTLFSIQSQMELDDYLERELVSKHLLPFQDKTSGSNFNSVSLLNMGTKWFEDKLNGLDMIDLKNYTISILSCIDKLNIANRYKHQLETLKQNPKVEFLYKCVDRDELLYVDYDSTPQITPDEICNADNATSEEQSIVTSATQEMVDSTDFRMWLIGSDEKKNESIAILAKYITDHKKVPGKDLAQLVRAAFQAGLLRLPGDRKVAPFHQAMEASFGIGKVGGSASFSRQLKTCGKLDSIINTPQAEDFDKANENRTTINNLKKELDSIKKQLDSTKNQ